MKKIKFLSNVILTGAVLCGTFSIATSCNKEQEHPEIKNIKLSYNGGKIENTIFTDKSEPIVFETQTDSSDKIVIKCVNNNIAEIDENNEFVPKSLGSTEVYAYFENDPDIKSNSINVSIQPSEDTLIISDENVATSSSILFNFLGTSVANISGFKADFTINNNEPTSNIITHKIIPEICWASGATFDGTVSIINLSYDIFGKSTFDLQISTDSLLLEDEYSFKINFFIDDSLEPISSKKLTLTTDIKEYYINDSTDQVTFSDDWKKITLTNFITNINIIDGTLSLTANINNDIFKYNPPAAINLINKKAINDTQFSFDVEIVWTVNASLDHDGFFSLVFSINTIEYYTTHPYEIDKIKEITSPIVFDNINIVDEEQPYATVSLKSNFTFTNTIDSHPFVTAQWIQPISAEQIVAPHLTEILDIHATEEYTTFKVKFTWSQRFDDSFHWTSFSIKFMADDKPVLFNNFYEITWHNGISYYGTKAATLFEDEGKTMAKLSKFTIPLGIAIYDFEISNFHWISETSLPIPESITAYRIGGEIELNYGLAFVWDETFDLAQDTSCTFDITCNGDVCFNDFQILIKKKQDSQFWDILVEERNASLTIITNQEDLIQVDVVPNEGATLAAYYLKSDDNVIINRYDNPYMSFVDNVITIDPTIAELAKGSQITIGIDYYTDSDETCMLNVLCDASESFRGVKAYGLRAERSVNFKQNKPIYFKIDFLSFEPYSIQYGINCIPGGALLAGTLPIGVNFDQWSYCSFNSTNCCCSVGEFCAQVTNSPYGMVGNWWNIDYDIIKNMQGILKVTPSQNWDNADVLFIFGN